MSVDHTLNFSCLSYRGEIKSPFRYLNHFSTERFPWVRKLEPPIEGFEELAEVLDAINEVSMPNEQLYTATMRLTA